MRHGHESRTGGKGSGGDQKIHEDDSLVVLMTPQGEVFNQKIAAEFAEKKQIIIICGRYEGVDERIREHLVDREISIGDYILTGGELAALVLIDAVSRLIPDVLGNPESNLSESFSCESFGISSIYETGGI